MSLRKIEGRIRSQQKANEESRGLVLMEVWWEINQAKHKRANEFIDWDTIDQAAERGLATDPWNVELHLELGHACRERGYFEVARFAYSCADELAPERADIQECLARLSELAG